MRTQLTDVGLIFFFFIVLFGIVGVTLFSGALHNRCTAIGGIEPLDDVAVCRAPSPGADPLCPPPTPD